MKRRALWWLLAGVLAVCVACGLWLQREKQQYARNRQLIAALMRDDTKTAFALVSAGADPNTHALPLPAPTLQSLLNRLLHRFPPPVNDSPTAFHIACGHSELDDPGFIITDEDPSLIGVMLDHGANNFLVDADNDTGLSLAVKCERTRSVELLLQHSAPVNVKDSEGNPPLVYAEADATNHLIRLLLEHGANPNMGNSSGETPLMSAAFVHNLARVRLLLKYGAEVNAQDGNGDTPLLMAVMTNGGTNVVSELLVHGANPNVAAFGSTPLMLARWDKCPDLIRLLQQHGAK